MITFAIGKQLPITKIRIKIIVVGAGDYMNMRVNYHINTSLKIMIFSLKYRYWENSNTLQKESKQNRNKMETKTYNK